MLKQHQRIRKLKKQLSNDLINDAIDKGNEFKKTKEGKKLFENYQKAQDIGFETDKWGKDFDAAEEKYLKSRAKYEAKQVAKQYGKDKFIAAVKAYEPNKEIKTYEDALKVWEDGWKAHRI